jgi:hypothetical protein
LRTFSTCVVLCAVGAMLPACRQPTKPSPAALVISGPRDIAPGATTQFRAQLRRGSLIRDVTQAAQWSTTAASILDVSPGGVVSAHTAGEATLRARYEEAGGEHQVFVVPAGTFRLAGTISEAESPTVLLEGALVEATAGNGFVVSASTNPAGSYSIFGLTGAVRIRVTKDGYHDWETTITVTDHARQDIGLPALLPRTHITGTFQLTIAASASCAADLPEDARRRSYTAVIAPSYGPFLRMTVQGKFFQSQIVHNAAEVWRERHELGVGLDPWLDTDPPYPGFTEWLTQTPPVLYEPVGTALLRLVDSGLAGTLNGSISVRPHPHAFNSVPLASCQATDHEFVLRR